jgi:hypothetical protein
MCIKNRKCSSSASNKGIYVLQAELELGWERKQRRKKIKKRKIIYYYLSSSILPSSLLSSFLSKFYLKSNKNKNFKFK